MPLQNRVMPTGEIVASPARGALMGNRGVLHNDRKEVLREFRLKAWITCRLEFKNRKRQLMSPGMYTELFFLDEVTAFAAGHRPCAECRRDRFNAFKQAWVKAHGLPASGKLRVADIDKVLHQQRIDADGQRPLWQATVDGLPVGAVFTQGSEYFAVHPSGLLRWTIEGYGAAESLPGDTVVDVVTPQAMIDVFLSGFVPEFHISAYE